MTPSPIMSAARVTVGVIGTSALILMAGHPSLHKHMLELWGASSHLWQSLWTQLHQDVAGGNEFLLHVGSYFGLTAFFWLFNSFFIFLELTGNPYNILQYRIQPKQKPPIVEWSTFARCVRNVLTNQLVVGTALHVAAYPVIQWRGGLFAAKIPTFHRSILEMAFFSITFEIMFYYFHRALHHPVLYRRIHKVHHEWTTPISISSLYCHPVEFALTNVIPLMVGPILLGSHALTLIVWVCIGLAQTSYSHCGFHLPFMPSNESHDFHHSQFNQNFGMLGFLDRLHGTDSRFRRTKSYERHSVLMSTTPANVLIPDERKKCH